MIHIAPEHDPPYLVGVCANHDGIDILTDELQSLATSLGLAGLFDTAGYLGTIRIFRHGRSWDRASLL